jgi:hypothetical protein
VEWLKHLPSKHKTLTSNPSTTKKKKKLKKEKKQPPEIPSSKQTIKLDVEQSKHSRG